MLKSVGMRILRSQSASLIFPPPRLPSESHRYFLFTCILKYLYPKNDITFVIRDFSILQPINTLEKFVVR